MRKGVKLAGLLAVGVAAFAVACSPVCNPRAPSQVSGRCGGVSGCGSACRWPVSDALHCR